MEPNSQFDRLIDEFESELSSGASPQIERYLSLFPEDLKEPILLELISIEVYYRLKNEQQVQASEYACFGETAENHAAKTLVDLRRAIGRRTDNSSNSPQDRQGARGQTKDATEPTSSRMIGHYRLIQEIGEGGMGTVWMAEQEIPVKRRVAIKLVKSKFVSADVLARFDAEKQALAMMDHQSIARVFDAGTSETGHPYLVMELVNGIPITEYCDNNKLHVEERLRLFLPVCKAVQHAHQKGIIHRDLKPSNVLVTINDGEAIPKVIDFGLAKANEHNLKLTDKTMLTEFGRIVGTVQYMSPEQAQMNGRDVDTRTDVYSLGVMLYELLTGSTPLNKEVLKGNDLLTALKSIREVDPPRPSNRLSSYSCEMTAKVGDLRQITPAKLQQILHCELDWVVMKAVENDRARRFPTVNDFAQDISNYLTGEAVIARPPSTWYQLRKFATRNQGLVASMIAIGLASIIGIAGTGYGLIRASQKADEAESQKQIAEAKSQEAELNEQLALREKSKAKDNEKRAIAAEKEASEEAQRARDAEAVAKFQLANARWEANRTTEARSLLHEIPDEYRNNFEWHFCNRRFQGSDITCYGHAGTFDGGVSGIAYSPDGTRVASAGADQTIKLWDAHTGQEIATFNSHEGGVVTVVFSPDGSRLASGGHDKTIRLWDTASGQEISTLRGHADTIQCVAFSIFRKRIEHSCRTLGRSNQRRF